MKGGYIQGQKVFIPQWGDSWEIPQIFNCPVALSEFTSSRSADWQIEASENSIRYFYLGGFRYGDMATQSGKSPRDRLSRDASCTLLFEPGTDGPHDGQVNVLYLGGHAKTLRPGNGYNGYNWAETFDGR
ncbi:hypothetical protein SDC9_198371 [bioreactor metagenome]|uniref:Uncharacterized protein n=1 Tax=bioreactor metagenome TaxID=1076179 RepID=A0A645IHG4_9ZZZZ